LNDQGIVIIIEIGFWCIRVDSFWSFWTLLISFAGQRQVMYYSAGNIPTKQ
jgi:hypothetical protein